MTYCALGLKKPKAESAYELACCLCFFRSPVSSGNEISRYSAEYESLGKKEAGGENMLKYCVLPCASCCLL